jgi:comEA protein
MGRKEVFILSVFIVVLAVLNIVNYSNREHLKKEYGIFIAEGNIKIPLNHAHADELEMLPGVGPVLARRIVEYREKKGCFRTLEELKRVKGIGDRLFEKIEGHIKLE